MNKQGILLIISGPSGSGKGTIVERLCEKNNFSLSISATTRKPREYEKDGVHYFFHTREEFEKMRDRKELLGGILRQLLRHTQKICNRTADGRQ